MSSAMNKPRFQGRRVKLGDVISKAKVERCGKRQFPALSMTMHGGIVEQRDRFKKEIASKDTSSYKVVRSGQLVVGFPIDEGVIYVQNHTFTGIMSPAYSVWDVNTAKVDPTYLELALHGPRSMLYFSEKMRGTTARRRSITPENLCALEIPLPSKEVQKSIASMFFSLKRLIRNRRFYLAKLDDLRKSRFVEMFGDPVGGNAWPMRQLNELYRIGSSKRIYAKDLVKGGVPFYRLADVGCLADGTNPSVDSYITEERYAGLKAAGYVPGADDILVTSRGTLGKCYIVSGEDKFYFQDGMITWLARTGMSPRSRYLVALFSNNSFAKNLSDSCSGTTVRYLSISDLAKMRVPVPPMDLQDEYLAFVRQVDKLESAARASIDKLQTLYDSLAQEYFG